MKQRLLAFAFLLISVLCVQAQLASLGDVPIDITSDGETRFVNGVAIAEDNVVIRYQTTTIYSDYAQYNPDTRDVLVTGNVRIFQDGRTFVGERAVYNLETKKLTAADYRGDFYPFRFTADSVSSIGGGNFQVKDGVFTTSDSSKPDYYLKAKSVRIYPKDRIVFSNVTLYVGKTPVFWWPYLYQSLDKDTSFTITPGYSSVWGAFLLTQYTFPINENISGQVVLDLRSQRGVAAGFNSDFSYGENDRSWGRFRSYYTDDSHPEKNTTSLGREPIDPSRYRVSLQHRSYITDDIYANIDINKLSDRRFLQDFFPSEYRVNPQPDNVVSLTKWDENYTITGIARAQFNDFFDTTERLPELVLDGKRNQLFGSPIFYENESSVARLRRNFAEDSPFSDYDLTRLDTFHQLLYPKTYGGWLSFIPRIGARGTYYTEGQQDFVTRETLPAVLPDGQPRIRESIDRRTISDDTFRPVLNVGAESSFKFSKAFEQVESRMWGLDGLRHVVQPYTNFSYVWTDEDQGRVLLFDRLNPSTQLPPLDFPQFTTIDSIDNWTVWRYGVRNRLQTRRDNRTINWIELDTFFDWNIEPPRFPGIASSQEPFSNVFNRLTWEPLPWVILEIDSQLPLLAEGFTEVNSTINFLVNENTRLTVGHRYIEGNPYFQDSSLINLAGYYRLGDNWGLSLREQYEIQDNVLESQQYEVHRDLSSWIASLGVVVRDNRGESEYGLLLTFTLKDLPQVTLPLNLDPQGEGAEGRNR